MLIILVRNYEALLTTIRHTAPIWLLVFWAIFSAFWSSEALASLHKSLSLLGMTAFGVFIAVRFKIEAQLKLLGIIIGIIALGSLLIILFMPATGIDQGVYRGEGRGYLMSPNLWRGIFLNSNHLGKLMAQGVLAFLFLTLRRKHLPVFSAAFLLCSILLIGSQSRTSLVAVFLSVIVFIFIYALSRQKKNNRLALTFLGSFIGISIFGLVFWNSQSVYELLGTDATLNNRTKIWTVLLEKAELHPLIGYGYGNVWLGEKIGVSAEVRKSIGWYPWHGHNGFIDLWLELGLVGLLLLLGSIVNAFVKGFRRILRSEFESPMDIWPMVYLSFVIVYNCAESDLLGYFKLIWPFSVAAMANLSFKQEAFPSSV